MSTKELRYMQVCIKIENGVVGKRCGADQPPSDDYLVNNHHTERGEGGALVFESAVEVSEYLDGSVHIYYKDMKIKEVGNCDIFNVA